MQRKLNLKLESRSKWWAWAPAITIKGAKFRINFENDVSWQFPFSLYEAEMFIQLFSAKKLRNFFRSHHSEFSLPELLDEPQTMSRKLRDPIVLLLVLKMISVVIITIDSVLEIASRKDRGQSVISRQERVQISRGKIQTALRHRGSVPRLLCCNVGVEVWLLMFVLLLKVVGVVVVVRLLAGCVVGTLEKRSLLDIIPLSRSRAEEASKLNSRETLTKL